MDLNIFILPDPSGKYRNRKYMMDNFPEEYDFINNHIKIDIPFKEKVHLYLNELNEVPICGNPNCDNKVKFRNSTLGYMSYCSNKCVNSDPKIREIMVEKSLEKYGTRIPSQSKKVIEKMKKTNQERYGGNSPMFSKHVQEKSKQTLFENWGVKHPSKSVDILKKRVRSFKNNIEEYKGY